MLSRVPLGLQRRRTFQSAILDETGTAATTQQKDFLNVSVLSLDVTRLLPPFPSLIASILYHSVDPFSLFPEQKERV